MEGWAEAEARGELEPSYGQLGELTSVRITWGGESIQPVQYNTFQVGHVAVDVAVPPDAKLEDVYDHWAPRLERIFQKQARARFQQWKVNYIAAIND